MEKYRGKYLFKYCNFLLDEDVKDELEKFESLINSSLVNLSLRDKNILMQKKEEEIKKKDYIFNSVIPKGELRASNCKGFRDILEYNNKSEYTAVYDCNSYSGGIYNITLCKDCLFYNNLLKKCNILNIEYFNKIYGSICGVNGKVCDACGQMLSDFLDYKTIAISFSRVLDNFSLLDWCSNGKGLVLQYKVLDNSKLYNVEYINGFVSTKVLNSMRTPNDLFIHSDEVINQMRMKFCEKSMDFCNEREVRFLSDVDLSKVDKSFTYQLVNEKEIGIELDSIIIYKNYYYLSSIGMSYKEKKDYEKNIVAKFKCFNKPIIFIQELEEGQFIHIYIDGKIKTRIHLHFHKNKKEAQIYHKNTFYMLENERLIGVECRKETICFYFINEFTNEERTQEIKWRDNFY